MCPIFIVITFDTSAMHRGTAADKPGSWPAVSCRARPNDAVFLLVCSFSFRYRICHWSGQLYFQRSPLPRRTFVRFLQGGLSAISSNTLMLVSRFLLLPLWMTSWPYSSSLNTLLAYVLSVTQWLRFHKDHFKEQNEYLWLEKQSCQYWICLKDDWLYCG